MKGDLVVVHLRHKGKSKTSLSDIKGIRNNRVKTDRCPEKFRIVLEIKRHLTSMISNDTQLQSEHSISQYY